MMNGILGLALVGPYLAAKWSSGLTVGTLGTAPFDV